MDNHKYTTHKNSRQELYSQIPDFWPDLYESEYALLDIKLDSQERIHAIRSAAEKAGRIFFKSADLLRQLDDNTLLQLGFPVESLPFIRLKTIDEETVIARIDFAVTDQEIKVMEINSDTPTFIKETFHVNDFVCSHFNMEDPNKGCNQELAKAIHRAISAELNRLNRQTAPVIVFTSHQEHEEDYLTAIYLLENCGFRARYIPLTDLRLIEEDIMDDGECILSRGLYTPEGNRIDLLYRQTYPIESLVEDKDPNTGESVGMLLLELVSEGRLGMINPPSAFLLQSKAIQALIWGLHEERNAFFTEEEHEVIKKHFLPTYLEPDYFMQASCPYVKKPSFGREGDTVVIYDERGKIRMQDSGKTYEESMPVFQGFISLPEYEIATEKGKEKCRIMYGCFLVNGKASAVGIRAGGQITGNESYFLPMGIKKEGNNE
ncbi:glutathionylspermidine synthase family protein [Peribacillus cavernae]|uniref:Glutathionylspermidine synthase family protein n=1 Tax=Peribacillus cavernae TaxID=1674310 RepID=A0A3S0VU73_9BACI|nr:glutathionylspermidine synthase family protein [Peribacillus cavernae]MDQ0220963.1 glutathionylspermidine synthase [Peribacillus cavernae]RUQ24512.1 glutathionylspermidine synthase family protein [Peribacillus cavernae]